MMRGEPVNLENIICYDMHYPDVVGRLSGSDVAYVPLNDAAYGYMQKQFSVIPI